MYTYNIYIICLVSLPASISDCLIPIWEALSTSDGGLLVGAFEPLLLPTLQCASRNRCAKESVETMVNPSPLTQQKDINGYIIWILSGNHIHLSYIYHTKIDPSMDFEWKLQPMCRWQTESDIPFKFPFRQLLQSWARSCANLGWVPWLAGEQQKHLSGWNSKRKASPKQWEKPDHLKFLGDFLTKHHQTSFLLGTFWFLDVSCSSFWVLESRWPRRIQRSPASNRVSWKTFAASCTAMAESLGAE